MNSKIKIKKIDITDLNVDAIVNAANEKLLQGGGVCGAIFKKAGVEELTKACKEIGSCITGNAVITLGFNLNSKYIIHAVGPIWTGGTNNEETLLYKAYKNSLELAKVHDIHSIGFPLISSGIYSYPIEKAWKTALKACNDFIHNNEYNICITFAVIDDDVLSIGTKMLFIDLPKFNMKYWCEKYQILFHILYEDKEIREYFQKYTVYSPVEHYKGLYNIIKESYKSAYTYELIIPNYKQITDVFSWEQIAQPTSEFVNTLTKEQIQAIISWHFRRDHFNEGAFISDTLANGYMSILVDGYLS